MLEDIDTTPTGFGGGAGKVARFGTFPNGRAGAKDDSDEASARILLNTG